MKNISTAYAAIPGPLQPGMSSPALAGAEGFEPPLAVLETAGLPLNLCPSLKFTYRLSKNVTTRTLRLLRLAVRLVFPAKRTEFFQLQPLGCSSLVLRLAVVPILAFTALELDNLTRH